MLGMSCQCIKMPRRESFICSFTVEAADTADVAVATVTSPENGIQLFVLGIVLSTVESMHKYLNTSISAQRWTERLMSQISNNLESQKQHFLCVY